uniref:Uncharacterized protein n=1 Tax=Romanomermis culicivorax TaxID=13658 RepID=A0A915KA56_ROMCU
MFYVRTDFTRGNGIDDLEILFDFTYVSAEQIRSQEQIRDCKIKCQKRSNKKQCAEKQDECDDICKNIHEGNLSQDDSLTPLILSFNDKSANSKFTEFLWNTAVGAKLYVVSIRPGNGTAIFQEVDDENFIFVKPRTCTLYELRVAYISRNDEADLVLSPFSKSVVIDALPKFSEPVSPKPAQLIVEKTPYFDETTKQKLDDSTIFLRHRITLPLGWSADDFRFVGKYWRVDDCKNFPNDKPPIVTFSRIVKKGSENFVEAKFPAYLGRSKCTVMNQTIDVCDKILTFPFESKDKMYKVILGKGRRAKYSPN